MPALDQVELGKWLRGETERRLLTRIALGAYHNWLPNLWGFSLSLPRAISAAIRGCFVLALGLLPIWLKFYDPASAITWPMAFWLTTFTVTALIYNHVYDRLAKGYRAHKVKKRLLRRLSLE